ncbi:hypothetical protein EVAR_66646_1 [Eumeta japonica]|uniref:Uncharacterized protein n=1 Tax=Eumeta variegata TaxID=151549 RepID=A0A4C1ZNL1_EUMVA|nr:hypothetical protein EVAR_66646_1 [Eumeta japonica]
MCLVGTKPTRAAVSANKPVYYSLNLIWSLACNPLPGRGAAPAPALQSGLCSFTERLQFETKGKGASGSFKLESKSSSGSKKSSGGGGGGSGGVAVGVAGETSRSKSHPPPLRREPAAAAARERRPRRPVLRRRNLKRRRPQEKKVPPPRPQRLPPRRCREEEARRPPGGEGEGRQSEGGVAPKAKKTAKPPTKTESPKPEGRDAEGET